MSASSLKGGYYASPAIQPKRRATTTVAVLHFEMVELWARLHRLAQAEPVGHWIAPVGWLCLSCALGGVLGALQTWITIDPKSRQHVHPDWFVYGIAIAAFLALAVFSYFASRSVRKKEVDSTVHVRDALARLIERYPVTQPPDLKEHLQALESAKKQTRKGFLWGGKQT